MTDEFIKSTIIPKYYEGVSMDELCELTGYKRTTLYMKLRKNGCKFNRSDNWDKQKFSKDNKYCLVAGDIKAMIQNKAEFNVVIDYIKDRAKVRSVKAYQYFDRAMHELGY